MADRKYDWAKHVVFWGTVEEEIEWNVGRTKEWMQ